MMPHLKSTVNRIQAGERLVLSYDDEPSEGGPLTPASRNTAVSSEESAKASTRSKKTSRAPAIARSARVAKSGAGTDASRNGAEPIAVMRVSESRSAPPP